ncbi:MAG: corrinoid protein [Candidatus Bathyarchaeia archaeon]
MNKLRDGIVTFDIEGVKKAAEDAIAAGISPYDAVMEGMSKGMDIVGKKYEEGEYFLAELIMAGETMKEGMAVLKPYLEKEKREPLGVVVLGTVQGDLHDIGKNVVSTLLTAAGFEVHDLGVDVPPEKFVEEVKNSKAGIIGVSALLTTTMVNMKAIIEQLERAGLRKQVKVIVGGAPLTDEYAKAIGADAYARDAVAGVEICRAWVKKK